MKPERRLATILFTDIVGSTGMAAELGDERWRELLEAHHALTRSVLRRFRGQEVNTTGDGFLATFDVPERAIRCACALRDAVRGLGIELRSGVHTGEIETVERTVGGLGVHIGARVAALAGPGEVLVSRTVRDLVAGSGFDFEDRGVHELRGVPGEWPLFTVTGAPVRLPVSGWWSRLREAGFPRALLAYAVAAGSVLWLTRFLSETFDLPAWLLPLAVLLLAVGLVVLAATAWVQAHPLTAVKLERDEVPGSWAIDLRDARKAIAHGRLPHLTWGRAVLVGAVALSPLFGLAGAYVLLREREGGVGPAEALASSNAGLAVLPFRVVGSGLDLWREGMVDLLSSNLDGAPGVRTIAPRTLLNRWRASLGDTAEPADAQALEVAREVGARRALVGSMVALGGEVRLTAQVYDLRSGKQEGEVQVKGLPDSLPALVDRLSIELLRRLVPEGSSSFPQMDQSGIGTSSLPALKAYLAGEQELRGSSWEAAIADFERALEADSTFALPLNRLVLAYGWSDINSPRLREYGERGRAVAQSLPRRQALLFRANWGTGPDWYDNLRAADSLTSQYPEDAEGWYALGDVYFHAGPHWLHPDDEFREAFRRALSLDPAFGPAYIHLITDAFVRGDSAEAGRLIAAYRRVDPASPGPAAFELAYALAWGGEPGRRLAGSRLASTPDETLQLALQALVFAPDQWRATLQVSNALVAEGRTPTGRQTGHRSLSTAFMTRGRLDQAREERLAAAEQGPFIAGSSQWILSARLAGLVDVPTADRAAADLASDTTAISRFLVGALKADRGEWRAVEAELANLGFRGDTAGAFPRTDDPWTRAPLDSLSRWSRNAYGLALQAYAEISRGDSAAGVRDLKEVLHWIPGSCPSAACLLHGALRYRLGRILLEQGELDGAERYLTSVSPYTGLDVQELYLGKLYEARGDLDRARLHYARFARWWKDSDPELRPMWEDARQALERLTGVRRL